MKEITCKEMIISLKADFLEKNNENQEQQKNFFKKISQENICQPTISYLAKFLQD